MPANSSATTQKTKGATDDWFERLSNEVMSGQTSHNLTRQKAFLEGRQALKDLENSETASRNELAQEEQDHHKDLTDKIAPETRNLRAQHNQALVNQQERKRFNQSAHPTSEQLKARQPSKSNQTESLEAASRRTGFDYALNDD